MFVRVKKIGNYEYLYLVENAREGGRHVQRVVKAARALRRSGGLGHARRTGRVGGAALATLDRAIELLSQ